VFEAITVVLAGEMLLGRRTIWLPARWQGRELGATTTDRAIPLIVRWVRRVQRFSRPRGAWLFEQWWMLRVLGLLFMELAVTAAVAPPFSGLDTLPALGAIAIALAVILEDVALLILGILLGTSGLILILTIGAALVHLVRSLV
jgi:hypothetical protein